MKHIDEQSISTYSSGEETIIPLKGFDVDHPFFGKINRYGWTSMKKLDEYTFSIGLKKL